ncbi:MAG: Rieske 2Fe-2S domain-containing protein [bacterium]|nr:Rieske 2Fe-2S domain-containing protein [bacterium]
MGRWVGVGTLEDVPAGEGRTVTAGDRRIALSNEGGRFWAVDDACPHQGASLATGTLHDGRVICPLHSWIFELNTGRCPRDSHDPVAVYATRTNGDVVEVQLPPDASPGGER